MQKSTKNLMSVIAVFTLFVLSFLAFMEALDLFAKVENEIPTDLYMPLAIYLVLTYVLFAGALFLYRLTVKNNVKITEEIQKPTNLNSV
jgi:divalent metal cation (Fe/Co/Zn/Cd) transporter